GKVDCGAITGPTMPSINGSGSHSQTAIVDDNRGFQTLVSNELPSSSTFRRRFQSKRILASAAVVDAECDGTCSFNRHQLRQPMDAKARFSLQELRLMATVRGTKYRRSRHAPSL